MNSRTCATLDGPIHRYTNLQPYRLAKGHAAIEPAVLDRLLGAVSVVDLDELQPGPSRFLRSIARELKIRSYSPRTRKRYLSVCRSLLRWFGQPPHLLQRDHVRGYLEYLYDAGHGSSDMGVQLSAIRTVWDKMCFRDVTLGLETPRKKRQRPNVPSREEVRRLLQAAVCLRDTLLIGLMYGAGLRVSEVVRLRWQDINCDRMQIFVHQGKGNADRHVRLPEQFRTLLQRLMAGRDPREHLFPSQSKNDQRSDRHLGSRTVQRMLKSTCQLAGIEKKLTPHSLRHAFATHSFEDGCDIRRIQAVLGHVHLETTTIYVSVATQRTAFPSPLDRLTTQQEESQPPNQNTAPHNSLGPAAPNAGRRAPDLASGSSRPKPVGHLRLHSRRDPSVSDHEYSQTKRTQVTLEVIGENYHGYLTGIIAEQTRPGFVTLSLPPSETWADAAAKWPPAARKRITDAEFYQILQSAVVARVLRDWKPPPPSQ